MAIVSIEQLYQDFKDGNVITEPNLEDLIDSCYNYAAGGEQVYELNVTLDADDLVNMSYDEGLRPYQGIELLPSPGKGKCYIPAYQGIITSYEFNNEAFVAKPYGEHRSLDIYYPTTGYYGLESKRQTIASISLSSDPYSTWCNRCFLICSDKDQVYALQKGKESLNIDTYLNSLVHVQWAEQGSKELSLPSLDNSPLYAATNLLLDKARSSTNGKVKIKMWYRIYDISDLITTSCVPYIQPSFGNDIFQFIDLPIQYSVADWYNPLSHTTFSDFDNYPGWDGTGTCAFPGTQNVNFDPDDIYGTFRGVRDAYLVESTELAAMYIKGTEGPLCFIPPSSQDYDDQNRNFQNMTSQPPFELPVYPGRASTAAYPTPIGIAPKTIGWSHNYESIKARNITDVEYDVKNKQKFCTFFRSDPSNSAYAAWIDLGESVYVTDGIAPFADGTCKRVVDIPIVNGGTNYIVGTPVSVLPAPNTGTGEDCLALVKTVDQATGAIQEIEIVTDFNNDIFFKGGRYYQAGTTAVMDPGYGSGDAVLGIPILEVGQWINVNVNQYYDGTQSPNGNFIPWEDIQTVIAGTKDAFLQKANQFQLTTTFPNILQRAIGFQIEKYLL